MDLEPISQELENLEKIIEDGLQSFVAVGTALLEIRTEKLYKERGFNTFEDYCKQKWGFDRNYANKHIKAYSVAQILGTTCTQFPATESHARELVPLLSEPDKMQQAWQEVQELNIPVTANLIRQVVQRIKPPPERPRPTGYALPGVTPDTKDTNRWGRGITANILTSRVIEQILENTEKLQDLPSEDLRLVANDGDIERWRAQLKEAMGYIKTCLKISED